MNLPKVTILMAIYKPNMQWLIEQLESLNAQTYQSLELLIWNDCPDDKTDYEEIYRQYITNFPFNIYVGEKNLGSNGAFEELTKLANSKYVAYCDQDDIWLPEKISILVEEAQKSNADVLCSDMYVIDGNSKMVADSITKVRPRHIFYEGKDLFSYLFSKNFFTGCTMLVKTEFAKKTLPFPKEFVHDWWLGIYAAAYGTTKIVKKPLIKYRIHGNNQTSVLAGVNTKKAYYDKRILDVMQRSNVLLERFAGHSKTEDIFRFKEFAEIRINYFNNVTPANFYKLFKMRNINKATTYFELALPFMPEWLFRFAIEQIRKGKI